MLHEHNRSRLFEATKGALVVLTAYDEMQQSGDMAAPFLQESSFWWLTGIEEPGWKLILDGRRRRTVLVRPARDDIDVVFNGALSDKAITAMSGIDTVLDMDEFEKELRQCHRHHSIVLTIDNPYKKSSMVPNPAQSNLHETLARIFDTVEDCGKTLSRLRAIKQPEELKRMQRAVDVTVTAFSEVRALLDGYKTENEIEAEFTYRFRRKRATHAYAPIVARGENACTLHYGVNNARIGARDLVLIDIGARVEGYSADITRTYCRNPTKRQRQVHAAVQQAQREVIALIEPGMLVSDYIRHGDMIMKRALQGLGLLDDLDDTATFRKYFPHSMGHGLGVDTHDSLGAPRYLEPGMVLTVEPGIYIEEEKTGVRIEDDILVTKTGRKNLSQHLSTDL